MPNSSDEFPPPGSIVITPKEFYDGVRDDIAEIKQAVSPLASVVAEQKDHETRIRRLEQFRWVLVGASAAAAGTVTSFVNRAFS